MRLATGIVTATLKEGVSAAFIARDLGMAKERNRNSCQSHCRDKQK
jgi:hypothetical protein